MSGINPQVIFAVTQIQTTFVDGIGNMRSGLGTGFFLRTASGTVLFITNKHNVDGTLKLGQGWSLQAADISLRRFVDDVPSHETKFVAVDLTSTRCLHSATADVSVLLSPNFHDKPAEYGYKTLNSSALATKEFLASKATLMDFVSFIGFPGAGKEQWWDQHSNSPIARLATLASPPDTSFTNSLIATNDITLVAGFSFNGSSGSPVFLHEKGVRPGGALVDPSYAPATILGIMSGHWKEPTAEPEMFRHSGLSYFTRATALTSLLSTIEETKSPDGDL